jgi:hypothetical protein
MILEASFSFHVFLMHVCLFQKNHICLNKSAFLFHEKMWSVSNELHDVKMFLVFFFLLHSDFSFSLSKKWTVHPLFLWLTDRVCSSWLGDSQSSNSGWHSSNGVQECASQDSEQSTNDIFSELRLLQLFLG